MVTVGTNINASDYNSIYTSMQTILASYGGILSSSAVIGGSTFGTSDQVSSAQLLNLFLDLQKTYVHQQGSISNLVVPPSTGYTIAADTSQNFNTTTGALSAVTNGTSMGINDYNSLLISLQNFNPEVSGFPVGNLSPSAGQTSTRATTWGGAGQIQSIYHVVTVTFTSATARQNFFNAGGEIRFTASILSGSGAKYIDWNAMLSAIGTIKFNKWNLTASSGTSAGLGEQDLTTTYQQVFIKTGSGVYADNDYTIQARSVSTTVLRFRIAFTDGDVGTGEVGNPETTPIDETVNGTATSVVSLARPLSSFVYDTVTYTAVDVAAPTVANQVLLSSDNVSPPA